MLNFPDAPSVGQKYPAVPTPGLPVYQWDGVKWGPSQNVIGAVPSDVAPLMDGVAAPGTVDLWSRGDHVHPSDTRYVASNNGTFTGTLTASTFNLSGDLALGGYLIAQAVDGHQLGGKSTKSWDNVTPDDANIVLYDSGSNNWAGIGVDKDGFLWVRTGPASDNQAAFIATLNNCILNGDAYAPSPANGDNSNNLATTAFVVANQPIGGPYLPTTGGTITGTMTVSNGHIMSYRAGGTTGVVYLSNGDRYFYYDGANYSFGSVPLYSAAGRLWGTADWDRPVYNARIGGHAGDPFYGFNVTGFTEPYAGAVHTGSSGWGLNVGGTYGNYIRYRYNQILVAGTWYTAGYV
jgi:hypothetical protein